MHTVDRRPLGALAVLAVLAALVSVQGVRDSVSDVVVRVAAPARQIEQALPDVLLGGVLQRSPRPASEPTSAQAGREPGPRGGTPLSRVFAAAGGGAGAVATGTDGADGAVASGPAGGSSGGGAGGAGGPGSGGSGGGQGRDGSGDGSGRGSETDSDSASATVASLLPGDGTEDPVLDAAGSPVARSAGEPDRPGKRTGSATRPKPVKPVKPAKEARSAAKDAAKAARDAARAAQGRGGPAPRTSARPPAPPRHAAPPRKEPRGHASRPAPRGPSHARGHGGHAKPSKAGHPQRGHGKKPGRR